MAWLALSFGRGAMCGRHAVASPGGMGLGPRRRVRRRSLEGGLVTERAVPDHHAIPSGWRGALDVDEEAVVANEKLGELLPATRGHLGDLLEVLLSWGTRREQQEH
jgi:hypothetical protein